VSQLAEVRRSAAAVAGNPRLLRTESAYALFAVNEQALWVVVLLWAYQAGGTALAGLVAVLQLVPAALLAPVGGIIGDRMARDRALRLVYSLQALSMATMAALVAVQAPRAAVVIAAVVATIVIGWCRPPHYAATTELSADPGEAAAANSLSGTLESLGCFIGPALAGIGALAGGYAVVMAACAVLAAAGAGLATGLRLTKQGLEMDPPEEGASTAEDRGGLIRVLVRRPAIAVVLLLVGAQFFAEGAMELLGVVFAHQRLGHGPAAAGLLIGSIGVGGTIGAVASAVLSSWRRLSPAVIASMLVGGLPLLAMPHLSTLAPALAIGVVTGAGLAFFAVAGITLLQRSVDISLVARVLAVRETALLTGLAFGAAAVPFVVRALGAGTTYAVLGTTLVASALLALPVLLHLEREAVYRPKLLALLRGIDFLAVLGAPELEQLALRARELNVPAGTVVIRQGEHGDAYYLVQEGQLEVSVAERPERVVLGPGDAFGEIALLRDVPRTATVRALSECTLWRVDRNAFLLTISGSAGAELAQHQVEQKLGGLASEHSESES